MEELIFFKYNCPPNQPIEEIAKEHPDYIKIYVTIELNEKKQIMRWSWDSGDILYIISNVKFDDISDYFKKYFEFKEPKKILKKPLDCKFETKVKKIKQRDLLSFFTKTNN